MRVGEEGELVGGECGLDAREEPALLEADVLAEHAAEGVEGFERRIGVALELGREVADGHVIEEYARDGRVLRDGGVAGVGGEEDLFLGAEVLSSGWPEGHPGLAGGLDGVGRGAAELLGDDQGLVVVVGERR